MGKTIQGALSYMGSRAPTPPNLTINTTRPQSTFTKNFKIGDIWIYMPQGDPLGAEAYILLSLASGVAEWVLFTSATGDIVTLTGNSGGPVDPDAFGNINILGDGSNTDVTGTPLNNTLTITLEPTIILEGLVLSNDTNTSSSAHLDFLKSRNQGPITAGDELGNIFWSGFDSLSNPIVGASINVSNPVGSTIGAMQVAGQMDFYTHPDSSAALPTKRMTVTAQGNVGIFQADDDTFDPAVISTATFSVLGSSILSVNAETDTSGAVTSLLKTRNLGPITSGDDIGKINFDGLDSSSNPSTGAAITSVSSGTIGVNRVAGNLQFWTHPDSVSVAPTKRVEISPNGSVDILQADGDTFGPISTDSSFQVTGTSIISTNNVADTTPASTSLLKTRSQGPITTGDEIGQIQFNAFDTGSDISIGGLITAVSTGTIGVNRIPTILEFSTHPNAVAASATLRMAIHENGVVTLAAPDTSTAALQVTGSVSVGGDPGVGVASHTDLTNGTATAAGGGAVTFQANGAGAIAQTGWMKFYINGVASYVPYFQTI